MFADLYRKRKVLITGHTGFKGSWLSAWLSLLDADICGISLPERTEPNHFDLLKLANLHSEFQDIRDAARVKDIFVKFQPEIVFHLAAQPLVRHSYEHPAETFETNLMGTVNVLEAIRATPSVKAAVVVTSDKCYENRNLDRGYSESDPMGGHDPYSASKGCKELIAASYRRSFFAEKNILLATARSGNVLGGGDWAQDRLVPNLAVSAASGKEEPLRNPYATRPWQHVLESLSGYLFLGQRLLEGKTEFADAWNFGPESDTPVSVLDAAKAMRRYWDAIRFVPNPNMKKPHEAEKLQLDCSKAFEKLHWCPVWDTEKTFEKTIDWYRAFYTEAKINTQADLDNYFAEAQKEAAMDELSLRREILDRVSEYFHQVHEPVLNKEFIPNQSRVPYAGRVFDDAEMCNLAEAMLDFWLTSGRFTQEFESKLAKYLNIPYALFVNSGSSANLLAFMTLTSPMLKERRIQRGDEVITVAAGFPTTVAPILQYGAVPVFVDVEAATANIDTFLLEQALSPKTKAVMLAHTLGNPFKIDAVKAFCDAHNLWLVEDNCDALGSTYDGKFTGTFGDIGTSSFYPPHHLTTGEGGAVYMRDPLLKKIALSLRDWGRDCECASGHDNVCGQRFSRTWKNLPAGYDHKYVYSHFGFNLKATDLQASIGCAQLDKLDSFVAARKNNFRFLYENLSGIPALQLFEKYPLSDPSWFGFQMTLASGFRRTRNELALHLEKNGIQTRNLFAGNIVRQPCFDSLKEGIDYRIAGCLENTDLLMNNALWIGVYPGMTREKLEFMVQTVRTFMEGK